MTEHVGHAQTRIAAYGELAGQLQAMCKAEAQKADAAPAALALGRIAERMQQTVSAASKTPKIADRAGQLAERGGWPDRQRRRAGRLSAAGGRTAGAGCDSGPHAGQLPHGDSLAEAAGRGVGRRRHARRGVGKEDTSQERTKPGGFHEIGDCPNFRGHRGQPWSAKMGLSPLNEAK